MVLRGIVKYRVAVAAAAAVELQTQMAQEEEMEAFVVAEAVEVAQLRGQRVLVERAVRVVVGKFVFILGNNLKNGSK
jgi:hypothetical protein